jgi:ribosome-binding factor A
MATNRRPIRLGEQILRDISVKMEQELSERVPGLVTFTRVRMSNDLKHATIYYSVLEKSEGDRNKVADYLEREKNHIRHLVGEELRVRYIPEFAFKFDPSIEEGIRIQQLLDEIKSGTKDTQHE